MIETHTHSQGISSFMRWAERRIAEEVEANEDFEKRTGESFVLKESTHLPHNLTDHQKRMMIEAVDDLRKLGNGAIAACNDCGLHQNTYFTWRRNLKMGNFKK